VACQQVVYELVRVAAGRVGPSWVAIVAILFPYAKAMRTKRRDAMASHTTEPFPCLCRQLEDTDSDVGAH
jgi:hypothetical protein